MDNVISLLNNQVLFDCELRGAEKKKEGLYKGQSRGVLLLDAKDN